jgi:hypothetical protein
VTTRHGRPATAGHAFVEIARQAGISRQRAHQIVRNYLAETNRLSAETIEDYRQQELDRLDTMQAAIWDKAEAGELKAIEVLVKIAQFRSRLLGLESPKRIDALVRSPMAGWTDAELVEEARKYGLPIPHELEAGPEIVPFLLRAG